jgi:hypothetical protein
VSANFNIAQYQISEKSIVVLKFSHGDMHIKAKRHLFLQLFIVNKPKRFLSRGNWRKLATGES